MLLSPEMGGLVTKMAQSMGFGQIWAKSILWAIFVAKSPISGLSNIYKSWFFDKKYATFLL